MATYPSISHRLTHQYQQIYPLLTGLSPEFVEKDHRGGKWSIREELAHLGRYQEYFEGRIKRILEEDGPRLGSYRAEEDKGFPAWLEKSLEDIHTHSEESRKRLLGVWEQLRADQISRKGHHPTFGLMDLGEWIEMFLLHEHHHIYVIFKMVMKYR